MNTRPVSIAHLVFGLIFLGAAALWAVGAATNADAPDLAVAAPAILIGAGAIGLVGIVVNARNDRSASAGAGGDDLDETGPERDTDTVVVDKEQQS